MTKAKHKIRTITPTNITINLCTKKQTNKPEKMQLMTKSVFNNKLLKTQN